jgi:ribonuclease J
MDLMKEAQKMVHGAILYTIKNKPNWTVKDIDTIVKNRLEPFFFKKKRRKPIIVSNVILIEKENEVNVQKNTQA